MGNQVMVHTGTLSSPAFPHAGQEYTPGPKPVSPGEVFSCWSQYLMSGRHGGLEEMIEFLFGSYFFTPKQDRVEMTALGEILEERRPERVLELGTGHGGTLFFLTRLASPRATIVSIDLPESKFSSNGYSPERQWFYERFRRRKQRLQLLRANSHLPWMPNRVKTAFSGQSIDFLLLDGDHRYAGIKEDFETYAPLVRKGGLIAIHDIKEGKREVVGGVPEFWRAIKTKYRYSEITNDSVKSGAGIGLLYVD